MTSANDSRSALAVVVACWFAGALVRGWIGTEAAGWDGAPDEIAWQYLLAERHRVGLRWDQLVHYPHEIGTVWLSTLAILLDGMPRMPSLSWASLVHDAVARAIELSVVWSAFGRRSAIAFAAAMVVPIPPLVPWTTVNFGLHAASAFWPYVALLVASRPVSPRSAALLGLVAGAALAWSPSNLALTAASALWLCLLRPVGLAPWLLACAVPLAFVAGFRVLVDLGFHQEPSSLTAVRGITPSEWFAFGPAHLLEVARLFPRAVWTGFEQPEHLWAAGLWLVAAVAGIGWALRDGRPATKFALLTVLLHILAYAFSPFSDVLAARPSYVSFRHLAYVFPILVAVAAHGWVQEPRRVAVFGLALLVLLPIPYAGWSAWPPDRAEEAAGWVLARKLGHDPERIAAMTQLPVVHDRRRLVFGLGWGQATALFTGGADPRVAAEELEGWIARFPAEYRPLLIDGTRFAFSGDVTPVLSDDARDVWFARHPAP